MYEIYAHSRQVRQRARALHQALVRGRRTKVVRQCLYGHCIFLPFFLFFREHPKITLRCFEGAPFKFRAPFGARTFSPLWTDPLQSFTPSVSCIPAGKRRSTRRKILAKSLAQSYLVLSDKLVCFNQKLYGLVAKWFPGVLPLHGTSARSPLTTAQSALVEERGHSTRALSYLAQARLGE